MVKTHIPWLLIFNGTCNFDKILVHVLILQNFSDIVAYFKKKCFQCIKIIFSTIRVKKKVLENINTVALIL